MYFSPALVALFAVHLAAALPLGGGVTGDQQLSTLAEALSAGHSTPRFHKNSALAFSRRELSNQGYPEQSYIKSLGVPDLKRLANGLDAAWKLDIVGPGIKDENLISLKEQLDGRLGYTIMEVSERLSWNYPLMGDLTAESLTHAFLDLRMYLASLQHDKLPLVNLKEYFEQLDRAHVTSNDTLGG
ncbi:MAG: hypothetical protein M1829_000290 [Trizodia sp. TS-e1964]|nr:MAG: hypothetical protein M1829_000290 [Trizodia sp. TS-e1964]